MNSKLKNLKVDCNTSILKCPRSGFTLMEIMVASSLFISVVVISSGAFVQALKNQRDIASLTSANNNLSQVIEAIAREVRTGNDFSLSKFDELNFANYKGEKVSYKLLADKTIGRCASLVAFCLSGDAYASLTSRKYSIDFIRFYYQGIGEPDGLPPRVTISIGIQGLKNLTTNIQTTVSSKNIGT